MNVFKIIGIVRHLLTAGGGFVVALGLSDEGTAKEVVGALLTLLGFAASFFAPEKRA